MTTEKCPLRRHTDPEYAQAVDELCALHEEADADLVRTMPPHERRERAHARAIAKRKARRVIHRDN